MSPDLGAFTPEPAGPAGAIFGAQGYATLRGAIGEAGAGRGRGRAGRRAGGAGSGVLDGRHGRDPRGSRCDRRRTEVRPLRVLRHPGLAPRRALVHRPELLRGGRPAARPRGLAPRLRAVRGGLPGRPARPGIGLLADRLAHRPPVRPHLDMWPGVAFTVHFDATSPANGFLRVLPGSHRGGPRASGGLRAGTGRDSRLPGARRRAVPPRRPVARRRPGDGGRGEPAVRRHLRGSWHAGARLEAGTAPTTSSRTPCASRA